MLPSPGAYDSQQGGSQHPHKVRAAGHQDGIRDVVEWIFAGRPCPCAECASVPLLPTPAVNDMGAAYTPEEWDAWTAAMKAKHNNGNGHGKSLNVEAQRMLPTPTRRDHKDSEIRRDPHRPDDVDTLARALTDVPCAWQEGVTGVARAHAEGQLLPTPRALDATGVRGVTENRSEESNARAGESLTDAAFKMLPTPMAGDARMARNSTAERRSEPPTGVHAGDTLGDITHAARWGEYEPTIRRWEALTRPAPEPTKLNAKGNPKLSDEFDEWLMGFPAGWITDVPGVTWNETLKACGNGVVWQQGSAAVRWLVRMGRVAS